MAETLVKNRVCSACGVDVRDGALFCYNCGSSVTADVSSPERNGKNDAGEKTEKLLFPVKTFEEEKIPAVENNPTAENNEAEITPEAKPELKSAASMRRRPKTIQRKRIEVTWEEPSSAPNIWFLLVAVLLIGLAFGLWLLASYLE
jgi:hypothetical protein